MARVGGVRIPTLWPSGKDLGHAGGAEHPLVNDVPGREYGRVEDRAIRTAFDLHCLRIPGGGGLTVWLQLRAINPWLRIQPVVPNSTLR